MANKSTFNWEKIGVYIGLLGAFWLVISQLFIMKDEIRILCERTRAIEVKVEKLEDK